MFCDPPGKAGFFWWYATDIGWRKSRICRGHVTNLQVLGHGYVACTSRICGGVGFGYWMPKLRVVESEICDACHGFGRGGERYLGVRNRTASTVR